MVGPSGFGSDNPLQVLLADGDAVSRGEIASSLSKAGMLVAEMSDGNRLGEFIRQNWAHVMVLDMDLPDVPVIRVVRQIRANEKTRHVGLVVICQPTTEKAYVEEFIHAGANAILIRPVDPTQVAQAVTQAAARASSGTSQPDQANVSGQLNQANDPVKAKVCETNSSLLVRPIVCHLHDPPATFDRHTLRMGKVQTEVNFFDVPVYTHPLHGSDYCNYHLLSMLICPTCLFTTNDPAWFEHPGQPRHEMLDPSPRVIKLLADHAAKRRKAVGDQPGSLFSAQRKLDEAILATRLGISCSAVLVADDVDTFKDELARIGNYHLKLAHLLWLKANPKAKPTADDPVDLPPPIVEEYRKAFETLSKAFTRVSDALLPKTIYQLCACGIYLGEDQMVHSAMQVLREFGDRPNLDGELRQECSQYFARCRTAWEDRDYHRLAEQAA